VAHDDEAKTQLLTRAKWLPPVERIDQLPTEGVEEGTRCFVDGDVDEAADEEVWEFRGGRWVPTNVI
jgi:hypothetical protein